MAILALVLYAVWAGTAFGLRMIIQWRRTGDSGFRRQTTRPGSAEWWARVLFVAALGLGVAAPVAALAGLDTFDVLDTSAFAVVGVACGSSSTRPMACRTCVSLRSGPLLGHE